MHDFTTLLTPGYGWECMYVCMCVMHRAWGGLGLQELAVGFGLEGWWMGETVGALHYYTILLSLRVLQPLLLLLLLLLSSRLHL